MKKNYKRIILLLIMVGLFLSAYFFGLFEYLTLDAYKTYRDILLLKVEQNYLVTSLLFVLVYIGVTALSIPGATVLTLMAGFTFGYSGVIHVNIGATVGATLAFLASRYIIGNSIQEKYASSLEKLNDELEKNGANYMLTLRFVFVFPFFLLNLLSGLTKVSVVRFIWTTSLGIIPGSMAYIYAGNQITNINSFGDVLTPGVLMAFLFLTIIAILPVLIKKISKMIKPESTDSTV